MVVGIDQKFWPRLMGALGLESLIEDERFLRGRGRYDNRAVLEPQIEAAFRAQPAAYWIERLREADHPAALVQDYAALPGDEQVRANGYLVEQQHPRFGRETVVGLHIQLSETPGAVGAAAPEIGADTVAVLRSAGFDEARIAALLADGVIAAQRVAATR
jgi:crotonobetainyl-CoA:carnitine CoA-transferase CaiB-like acyl-CoA transferase